ncbi:hypothetical protein PR048_015775 [Dryococelus australis]|uniref:Uncharacterized protein n=1 Tax=Dryococelus australis TaxID=614101 RepID=A0ABQ9HHV7_9NEOP|nr:hypothetical protein PR048_015775 [Dryococelus australis]
MGPSPIYCRSLRSYRYDVKRESKSTPSVPATSGMRPGNLLLETCQAPPSVTHAGSPQLWGISGDETCADTILRRSNVEEPIISTAERGKAGPQQDQVHDHRIFRHSRHYASRIRPDGPNHQKLVCYQVLRHLREVIRRKRPDL